MSRPDPTLMRPNSPWHHQAPLATLAGRFATNACRPLLRTTTAASPAAARSATPQAVTVASGLAADLPTLRARAHALAARLTAAGVEAVAVDAEARVGGGGAPEHPLPSAAVALPAAFAEPLRHGRPPVVGYLEAAARC